MAVRRKSLTIKPDTPGQRIEWRGGSGTVWSAGPLPRSVWAVMDDDPETYALVKLPTPTHRANRLVRTMSRAEQSKQVKRFEAQWEAGYLTLKEALEIASKK